MSSFSHSTPPPNTETTSVTATPLTYNGTASNVIALPAPTPAPTPAPVIAVVEDGDPREIYQGGAELIKMLRYMRPAWSTAEEEFIEEFVKPLGAEADDIGNYWLTIAPADPDALPSPILWSSHTDTVHAESGYQKLEYGDGWIMAKKSSCLGADCTAGVWIMSEMIKAKIPGTYVFHRAEEIGGVGSRFAAKNYSAILGKFNFAIAFDRKGQQDIITHQFGRTASDTFAHSMAAALHPMLYLPSSQGIFTDTQSYSEIISECTNLSVGYESAHSPAEKLFLPHLIMLRDTVIKADFSGLVAARDPTVKDVLSDDDDWWKDPAWRRGTGYGNNTQTSKSSTKTYSSYPSRSFKEHAKMDDIVYDYPNEVALFLEENGFSVDDLNSFIATYKDVL